jgi:hypothetical protein
MDSTRRSLAPGEPIDSWRLAESHYRRAARRPDLAYLADMRLVVEHARRRGYERHYYAYTLPEFLAISPARSPEEALTTPFLSVALDRGGVFELTLVAPATGLVIAFRVPRALLFHELDTSFASLGELLVSASQGEA